MVQIGLSLIYASLTKYLFGNDNFSSQDATVVCRQLGFPGVDRATIESEFGSVSSTFAMDNVRCQGKNTIGSLIKKDVRDGLIFVLDQMLLILDPVVR